MASGSTPERVMSIPGIPDENLPPLDIQFQLESETEDGGKVYIYDVDVHAKSLLANMRSLLRRNQFTDVMLLSSDKKTFRYHSVLLAACSPMLRTLLSGSQMQFYRGTLAPRNVTSAMLQSLQDYIYRPDSVLEYPDDRDSLYSFATSFEMEELAVDGMLNTDKFIETLGTMYSSRCLTFGVLSVDTIDFPCHYALISAAIPLLRQELTRSDSTKESGDFMYRSLPVRDATPETMSIILEYIYNAKITIHPDIVQDLLLTSTKMRVLSVAKACCDFISTTLEMSSLISHYRCAKQAHAMVKDPFCKVLLDQIGEVITSNFDRVIQEEEFFQIENETEIILFLSRADLSNIDKMDLSDALQNWCEYDPQRKPCLPSLLALLAILKDANHLFQVIQRSATLGNNPTVVSVARALKGNASPGKTGNKSEEPRIPKQQTPKKRDDTPSSMVTTSDNKVEVNARNDVSSRGNATSGAMTESYKQQNEASPHRNAPRGNSDVMVQRSHNEAASQRNAPNGSPVEIADHRNSDSSQRNAPRHGGNQGEMTKQLIEAAMQRNAPSGNPAELVNHRNDAPSQRSERRGNSGATEHIAQLLREGQLQEVQDENAFVDQALGYLRQELSNGQQHQ